MSAAKIIRLRNVRVNNLKSVSLDIPHGQWLAVCGISGSGKSSLAFDTLYAEGQRRYLECLSPGTRKFFLKWNKPDADLLDGLPPAIAVKRTRVTPSRTETVGNATEITEYLRVVFAHAAGIICPSCQVPVVPSSVDQVSSWLQQPGANGRLLVAFKPAHQTLGELQLQLQAARRHGFVRAVLNQQTVSLDALSLESKFESQVPAESGLSGELADNASAGSDDPLVIVDRLTRQALDPSRLRESLETAFQFGNGHCLVLISNAEASSFSLHAPAKIRIIDQQSFHQFGFSQKPFCVHCGTLFPAAEPGLFNFNSTQSACLHCFGAGYLDAAFRQTCTACNGDRMQPAAAAYVLGGKRLAELCRLNFEDLASFLAKLELIAARQERAQPLLEKISARLEFLSSVGLGYLPLDRPLQTVSTGEAQRLHLTTCLSSKLVNMLYILDEPSSGLHADDLPKLLRAIELLNQRPNTVVMVDHNPTVIRSANRVIEIGPGAGNDGGTLVFDGSINQLLEADTHTGHFLSGKRGLKFEPRRRLARGKKLQLFGARGNNLKSVNVDFPLGCLCAVTGVSGAGKSSLVRDTLLPAAQACLSGQPSDLALPYRELIGCENLHEVVMIDPAPIGRSGRSNPVIHVKAFDEIRQAFAETADAKQRQATPGHFSFNVVGGRCEKCQGDGFLQYDLQFMADVVVKCDECQGTRFRASTLEIKYRGLNIAEVLQLTAREAFTFFRGQPKVQAKLKALIDVGLDYIRLGQPANTLSGGESQRLKLALYLNVPRQKRTLFVMEEPTAGLHPSDVTRLLDGFDSLISAGHSFIVVEHNLQLIQNADWIIDLGPGPADRGGQVVATGPPEELISNPDSITARYLKRS